MFDVRIQRKKFSFVLSLLVLLSLFTGLLGENGVARADSKLPALTPWAVIMCKFADKPAQPKNQQYFSDLFTISGAGKGGLYDYWNDMSYDQLSLNGSAVRGWFTMPQKYADEAPKSRFQQIKDCIDTAVTNNAFYFPSFYGIAVMYNNAPISAGSIPSASLTLNGVTRDYALMELDSGSWNVTFAAHEMGHGYGLDHSFDTSPVSCDPPNDSRPGAYCDKYDIMSAQTFGGNHPTFTHPIFGNSGPSLSAPQRYALGWIPGSRIWSYGIDCCVTYPYSATITLANLNTYSANGYLMARVYYTWDLFYTVEFRRKQGWDQNIASDGVIIHQVAADGLAYLELNGYTGLWRPGQDFIDSANNLRVSVMSFDPATNTAKINIGMAKISGGGGGGGGGGGDDGGYRPPCHKATCMPHAQ